MILALSMVLSILPVSAFADAGAASAANKDGETIYEENSAQFTVYVNSTYADNQEFKYAAGDSVEITAPKREGYTFQNWVISYGPGVPADTDVTQETIRFTMPASFVVLIAEANLDVSEEYLLVVEGDNYREEKHKEDDQIEITAPDLDKEGKTFNHWEVSGLPSDVVTTNKTITFKMPAHRVILTPKYGEPSAKKYFVFVDGGETKEYAADEKVSITAPPAKEGETFDHWEADCELADADLKQETITFTMPAGNVNLTPKYKMSQYTLTVKDENGKDIRVEQYEAGQLVSSTASEVPGNTFIRWEAEGLPEQDNRPADFFTNSTISFNMPQCNVTLTPVYAKKYTLTLTGGKTEQHFEGDTVTVKAPEQPGFTFNGWKTTEGLPKGTDTSGTTITFKMPDNDVTIEADLIPTPAPDPAPKTFALKVNKAQATLQNGAAVDLTAVPVNAKLVVTADEKEGYTFTGWETEGLPEGTDITGKTITFEMPANDVKITAKMNKTVTKTLKIDKATVTLQDGSAVADLNAVPVGTKLVATADADTDTSVFKKWNCTGLELTEEQSTARELKFDMPDQDVELTAVFEAPATPDPEPTPDPKPNPDPDPEPTPDPDPAPAPSDDGSAAVIVAATVVGGAAVGVGAYMVGTTVYLKSVLPEGVAIPANRQQLAVALWTAAGKPATQSTALFNDVAADAAELQAIRWVVETGLMTAQDGSFKPGSRVSRLEVIRTWKNYQKRG